MPSKCPIRSRGDQGGAGQQQRVGRDPGARDLGCQPEPDVKGKSFNVGAGHDERNPVPKSFSAKTTTLVTLDIPDCAAPAVGKVSKLSGFSRGTQVKASFTSPLEVDQHWRDEHGPYRHGSLCSFGQVIPA